MPEATLTIRVVKPLKSGDANGRAWTLYEVQTTAGRFTTFDDDWQRHIGETVNAIYEETQNGRYTNRVLGECAKAARPDAPAAVSAAPDRFTVLNESSISCLTSSQQCVGILREAYPTVAGATCRGGSRCGSGARRTLLRIR